MSPIPAPDADSVDRTGSIGLEAAAGPAHNVTRANDFMDLSPPLRNFFSPKENGAASGAIRESESSLFNRLRRQIGGPLADSPSGRTCVARPHQGELEDAVSPARAARYARTFST